MDNTNDNIGQKDQRDMNQDSLPESLIDGPSIADNSTEDSSEGGRTQNQPLSKCHWDFIDFEENYIDRYIALADIKAGLVFAVSSGVIVYLVDKEDLFSRLSKLSCSFDWLNVFLSFFFLLISIGFSFWVIAPRLWSTEKGTVFWGGVAKHKTSDDYLTFISKMDYQELLSERVRHAHDIARVCSKKYYCLTLAMWAAAIGIFLSFLLLI